MRLLASVALACTCIGLCLAQGASQLAARSAISGGINPKGLTEYEEIGWTGGLKSLRSVTEGFAPGGLNAYIWGRNTSYATPGLISLSGAGGALNSDLTGAFIGAGYRSSSAGFQDRVLVTSDTLPFGTPVTVRLTFLLRHRVTAVSLYGPGRSTTYDGFVRADTEGSHPTLSFWSNDGDSIDDSRFADMETKVGSTIELRCEGGAQASVSSNVVRDVAYSHFSFDTRYQVFLRPLSTGVSLKADSGRKYPSQLAAYARDEAIPVGGSTEGTVSLAAPAPAGGTTVTLTSSIPEVTVPSTVQIPEGALTATFPIQSVGSTPVTASILAHIRGGNATLSVRVQAFGLASLKANPKRVIGGTTTDLTLRLTHPAPTGGIWVTLVGSNVTALSLPTSIFVPEGAVETTFGVGTASTTVLRTVTVTASLPDGSSRSVDLKILPN